MKKLFKLSNLYPLTLVVYIAKSFAVSPSFFDFGVILIMSIGFIYKIQIEKDQRSDKDELLKRFHELEQKYKKDLQLVESSVEHQISEINTKVSRNSLGVGLKPQDVKNSWSGR